MATRAVRTHLATMLIRVAAYAIAREPQFRPVQIFALDAHTPARRNVLGLVTFLAGHSRMFSFERITRLIVIKRFAVRGIPANHVEIHSIVIGMALRTLLARRVRPSEGGVQA